MLPFLVLLAGVPAPAAEDLQSLVDKVESHYESVADFEADFIQRYERRLLQRTIEESGKVAVKKPGRMRWEYRLPEEKLFVTDGSKSYFYLPLENQVMVSDAPEGAMGMEEGSPFELLTGKRRITESFAFFPSDSKPAEGGVMLRLEPLKLREEFENVELEIRESDGRVLRVVLNDAQKNRTEYVFRNVRENVGVPEERFRFAIPSGVEVVVSSERAP
jgi:outer membrane lipoprotein carrier protein